MSKRINPNVDIELVVTRRMRELQKQTEEAGKTITEAQVKMQELESLLELLAQESVQLTRQKISENIKKNTLKGLLPDEKDAKKINLFFEFIEKCGDETTYLKARAKMPKLESYLYRKNKLWNGWDDFKTDLRAWVNREGQWQGVLAKDESEEGVDSK